MTTYYVDPTNGNDSDDGLSWANALLTLNGAEDEPVAAGDIVHVGPGVYRETLTCDVSGGNTYSTGTCDVTNASDQVTGNGTTWGGNVAADYYLHVRYYDNGADGVTNGTATFTAAGGNFQAAMIGCPIQINTKGAYIVGAVGGAGTLTLADPNTLGWPAAGAAQVYSIMSGEGHYEIESVDDNTTITLKQPWQGKTLTVLDYLTFNAITYIADVTGENTDGIGGIVRITGSDNDQTAARTKAIFTNSINYRVFRGFSIDTTSSFGVHVSGSDYIAFEDCVAMNCDPVVRIENASLATTIRRCMLLFHGDTILSFDDVTDDTGIVIENTLIACGGNYTVRPDDVGGSTFRNCAIVGGDYGMRIIAAPNTGQCLYITQSILMACDMGMEAQASGQIIEDYNCFDCDGNRTNVGTGANSVDYSPVFESPILHAGTDQLSGYKFPWLFGELSDWAGAAGIAGADERNTDLFGIRRPATAAKNSWGPVQYTDAERETTTTRGASAASMRLGDAGRFQMWVKATPVEITVSVYVYREANYAGGNPQMIIKQPGVADQTTTDAAAASQWNLLTDTLTPDAGADYIVVELVSQNTAAAGNYDVFFDDLDVS